MLNSHGRAPKWLKTVRTKMHEPIGDGAYAEIYSCKDGWEPFVIKYGGKLAREDDSEDNLDGFPEMSGAHAMHDVTKAIIGQDLYLGSGMNDRLQTFIKMKRGARTLYNVIFQDDEEGDEDRSAWDEKSIEEREAIIMPLVSDVACILAAAHRKNIWHLDVKLDNVLLFEREEEGKMEERACLIDWGFAVQNGAMHRKLKHCLFALGYKPPELCLDVKKAKHTPTGAMDVWAFGILLLEALTDWDSTTADNEDEHLERIFKLVGGIAPSTQEGLRSLGFPFSAVCTAKEWDSETGTLPEYCEALSPEAQDLIRQCLQFNPEDRPTFGNIIEHPFFGEERASRNVKLVTSDPPLTRPLINPDLSETQIKIRNKAARAIFRGCETLRYENATAFGAVALMDAVIGTPAFFQNSGAAACVFASAMVHEPVYIEMDKFAKRFDEKRIIPIKKLKAALASLYNACGGFMFFADPYSRLVHRLASRHITAEQQRYCETRCAELAITEEYRTQDPAALANFILVQAGMAPDDESAAEMHVAVAGAGSE